LTSTNYSRMESSYKSIAATYMLGVIF
jgi:hypothetical protein